MPDNQVRFDRFHILSQELLRYSTRGLLRKDFLPMVSSRLRESSRSDAVELWVKEGSTKHFRCSMSRYEEVSPSFLLVPRPLGEEPESALESPAALAMERLCCNVIKGIHGGPGPWFTERGSFSTGDTKRQLDLHEGGEQQAGSQPLQLPEYYRSVALIPIEVEGECIGLLQLKSRERDFYLDEEITFYEDVSEVLGIALTHQYAQIELRERIKELTCLYGIAQLVARPGATCDETIQSIVELLPPAWLYPEIACARIVLEGKSYVTSNFSVTGRRQSSSIRVGGKSIGSVEVGYLEERTTMDEGPFLEEERSLIDSVAGEVASFVERTKAEEERALLQDQLRHADRLATIGQIAAGVAHELNEPLGNILGFAQLAKKAPGLHPQVEKDLKSIESASLHTRDIIKKLMVFARQLPPKKAPVILNDLINEGLSFFEARCAKSGVELVRNLAPSLPAVIVDPGQMNQALVNLVVNALQAMPDGGRLTVKTKADDDHVMVIVEDTGAGMSDEVRKQIFLPFFTTKDVNEGTGLGLAVVHGIVSSHGGVIEVESEEGSGSRFIIHLPVSRSDRGE